MSPTDDQPLAPAGAIAAHQEDAGEAAEHEDLAVREVDQLQHAVDERVTQGDDGVKTSGRQPSTVSCQNWWKKLICMNAAKPRRASQAV